MTEGSHDLDERYVYHAGERTGVTETLLLQDDGLEMSRGLPYLLLLTCGGAGYILILASSNRPNIDKL